MDKIFLIIQVITSILLMILILSQAKDGGLSTSMGGGQSFEPVRRGPEKVIFRMTVFLAFVFLVNAFLVILF